MQVVLHAHFYQPPRENPWTRRIPRQDSARPAHDWNERVTDECYRPNARSRVMGPRNLIDEIVNNYATLSFDFGPTLLVWLERHAPGVYEQILAGDRLSVQRHQGHGNAIAHAYNHMILPLANYRDRRTQIIWGLRDFEWRFGRKSESIWLAETAINLETTKMLIEHGVRYVILSPYQALRARPLDRSRGWSDVTGGKIDPRQPYRYFLKDARRRRSEASIDVFFYDGQLASDVSFAHLLRSAPTFAERLQRAGAGLAPGEGLVHVATDGEVYGHHEPFGDMCLSFLARREGAHRGLEFTNYGLHLDQHPPTQEVDLNFGDQDEGTAWSCAHGVGRWERDCGCSTGGREGWNQRWRTPLRRGFDTVRDRLVETYLETISPLVRDPWALRDDYILALLDPGEAARNALLQQHARRELSADERRQIWSLLEAQRYAMFMYTSCGWFFADVSGIETVQNMAFAARAIELAQPWQRLTLEEMLLDYLGEAHSNIPEFGTGADVYVRFVNPQRVRPAMVAGGAAMSGAVMKRPPADSQFPYRVRSSVFEHTDGPDGVAAWHGRLELVHEDTEEVWVFTVHVFHDGPGDLRCYVHPTDGPFGGRLVETEVQRIDGVQRFSLRDLVAENREQIIRTAYESILREAEHLLGELFEQGRDLITTCREAGVEAPAVLRAAAGHVLEQRLAEKAARLESGLLERLASDTGGDPRVVAEEQARLLEEIAEVLNFARQNELEVSIDALVQGYGRVIRTLLERLVAQPDGRWARQCEEVIRSSYELHFPLDRRPLEDLGYRALLKHKDALRRILQGETEEDRASRQAYEALAEALHLHLRSILEQENGDTAGAPGS